MRSSSNIILPVANMMRFAALVFLCAQTFARPGGENVEIDPHMVGGKPAPEGQYPFIVSLRQRDNFTFCGGALLSKNYVLTAAHCVVEKQPNELIIGAGSVHLTQQKLFDIENITIHEDYKVIKTNNDIALIKLKTPVPVGGNIQLINYPVTQNITGRNVTALGWGRTSPDGLGSSKLMYLNRRVLDNDDCSKKIYFQIIPSQVCVEGEKDYGMCFGDSGSPLLFKGSDNKNYIAGVVSWGIPCAKGFPDVFTRVSSFTQWIKNKMV